MDISQKILSHLKLDYDVVEDLKRMKANIRVFELCKLTQLRKQLPEYIQHIQVSQDVTFRNTKVTHKGKNVKANKKTKNSSVTNTSMDDKAKTTDGKKKGDPRADQAFIGKKSRSKTPLFILTFEIFNRNVHNCLVDSRVSSNIMSYLVCKKLNRTPYMKN